VLKTVNVTSILGICSETGLIGQFIDEYVL